MHITHDSFKAPKSTLECVLHEWCNVMQHMFSIGILFAVFADHPSPLLGLALNPHIKHAGYLGRHLCLNTRSRNNIEYIHVDNRDHIDLVLSIFEK